MAKTIGCQRRFESLLRPVTFMEFWRDSLQARGKFPQWPHSAPLPTCRRLLNPARWPPGPRMESFRGSCNQRAYWQPPAACGSERVLRCQKLCPVAVRHLSRHHAGQPRFEQNQVGGLLPRTSSKVRCGGLGTRPCIFLAPVPLAPLPFSESLESQESPAHSGSRRPRGFIAQRVGYKD